MGRPVHILELRSTYGYGGGPDKTILQSAARHDPDKFRVTLCYLRGARDTEFNIGQRARELGLEASYHEIVEQRAFSLGTLREIGRLIKEHRIDVVHAHEYKTDILAWLLRRRHRRPAYMTTAHGWVTKTRALKLYNRADLRVMRGFDRVVAVSGSTRERLIEAGVAPNKIELIHNAIDERVWSRDQVTSTLREELGLKPGTPLVGTVTRLGTEKDLPTFLAMAKQVLQKVPDAHFVVVGDGPRRQEILDRAAELDLTQNVNFTLYRNDLPNIYAALDVHVITSLTEGLPNMLLEAMAMGLATVSTNVGGIPEVVTDGEDGYLCDPGDTDGIAERVTRLLTDRLLADGFGVAARHTIESRFSFAARTRRIEELYGELAASKTR